MPDEFDPNKVAAEFIQANLEKAFALGQDKLKGAKDFVRSRFEYTYTAYINRLMTRYSNAKSFFVRSEPIPLYDFFVPLDLSTQRRILKGPGATELATVSRASVISPDYSRVPPWAPFSAG